MGVQLDIVSVQPPATAVLEALSSDVDAVYLTPLTNLSQPEWDGLVAGLIERRLPTFSYFGVSEVERGVLASLNPQSFFPRLADRRLSQMESAH
jgi:hypothetical protein